MPVTLNDLCPYRSLLLSTCPNQWNLPAAVEEIRGFAEEFDNIQAKPASGISNRHGLTVKFFYYRIEQPPTWLLSRQIDDVLHELVVVFRRGSAVAILTTESRLRDKIRGHFGKADQTRIGALTSIPAAVLNSAYVRGRTNTLWLTGTHRQVPSQVDNKAISGPDLLYALDPLSDQSFLFTSAVSRLPQNVYRYQVGVSPHRSYIWGGPSEHGGKLCEGVAQLFDILQNAPAPNANPLPMLAAPALDAAAVATVADAYEAALLPSELLDYDLPPDLRTLAETWNRLDFDIIANNGAAFDASISLVNADDTETALGNIRISFDLSRPDRITWTAARLLPPAANQELQDGAIEIINTRRSWFKVWFESGHTLVDQKIFTSKLRDAQFEYSFGDFAGFSVKTEKPSPLTVANIGAQTSLFCWVRNRWHRGLPQVGQVSGWLACNDGAMEIADFIHFDQVNGHAELTLVHVKGSKRAAANRQLSVSDYEVVVGQAIKNLRFLDLQNTVANFSAFLNQKLLNVSWRAGAADTRANMLAAMNGGGPPPRRRVVIVQPSVRRPALNAARAAPANTRQALIAKQLDTLLLAAQANCRNLGAEFAVIADHA